MQIIPQQPTWGDVLQPGYCGFITRQDDIVGDGIEYFSRWTGGLPFVHTFVISGPNEVIEAHAVKGVSRATLDQYLGQKNCRCFIRIPAGYTPEVGAQIVAAAATHLGEKYGYGIILADVLANTFIGHVVNDLTHNAADDLVCKLLDNAHAKICSQLVALALQSQPFLKTLGCLADPAATITPELLGNDSKVFGNLAYKIQ